MTKKNIIFFLPNFILGGASEAITKILKNINKKKFNTFLICLNKCSYINELKKNRVKVIIVNRSKTIFAMPQIKDKIKKISKNQLQTIFISNINYANILSIIFLRKIPHLKIITVDRTPLSELDEHQGKFIKFLKNVIIKFSIKILYKYSDIAIANSKIVSNRIEKFSNRKFYTIYSQSISKIKKFKIRKYKRNTTLNILWIGRLSEEKNFMTMIETAEKLKHLKIKIYIAGDGKLKNILITKINKLNLNHKFVFLGFKKDLQKYFNFCHLNINTSIFESFPNSVAQSINNSLPIIASKSGGGIDELLGFGKFGHMFEVNNSKNLSKYILKFIKKQKDFYTKAYKAHKNLRKFNFDKIDNQYEKIFLKL